MEASTRLERALASALARAEGPGHPPRLLGAMRHAVFPGGARVRPRLCLAVAAACGIDDAELVGAAAVALELLHCASLVHDDLPCFDDAATRRGRPSVQRAFGERLAVLSGDALIVLAFQVVAEGACASPKRLAPLLRSIAAGVGLPTGIAAGQAWECEHDVELRAYHRAKTGALFASCTESGALAVGADPEAWRPLGECLGEAYQVADDLRDATGNADALGKPVGRDAALGRPNIVHDLGVATTLRHFESLVHRAESVVPPCAGAGALRKLVRDEAERLIPRELAADCVATAA